MQEGLDSMYKVYASNVYGWGGLAKILEQLPAQSYTKWSFLTNGLNPYYEICIKHASFSIAADFDE
jgi:hypothetical protein